MIYVIWLPEEQVYLSMSKLVAKDVNDATEFTCFESAQQVAFLVGGIVVDKEKL